MRITMVMASTIVLAFMASLATAPTTLAQTPAKKLFGTKPLPAALKPAAYGFYSKGCLSGGVAIPMDGPNWQAMRLSRNRRWGHPDLIKIIEDLSYKAKSDGWNGLLVGDISQPRGGPMLTGHRSHQMGLDADIWFSEMPNRRMTYKEREETSAVSVLKKGTYYVDKARWKPKYTKLLKNAATYSNVERVLVHPGVKKQLCESVRGDRQWLSKIRPIWGHHYHFHIRMACPSASAGCRKQNAPPRNTGCNDGSLDWWFKVGLVPKKPKKGETPKKRRELILSDLPKVCRAVLGARDANLKNATHTPREAAFVAPEIDLPAYSATAVLKGRPIEAKGQSVKTLNARKLPIPTQRPSGR